MTLLTCTTCNFPPSPHAFTLGCENAHRSWRCGLARLLIALGRTRKLKDCHFYFNEKLIMKLTSNDCVCFILRKRKDMVPVTSL
jgi:hypothetical protein